MYVCMYVYEDSNFGFFRIPHVYAYAHKWLEHQILGKSLPVSNCVINAAMSKFLFSIATPKTNRCLCWAKLQHCNTYIRNHLLRANVMFRHHCCRVKAHVHLSNRQLSIKRVNCMNKW